MLNKRGALAVSQILVLVIGIIAFGFLIGEMKIISAPEPEEKPNEQDPAKLTPEQTTTITGVSKDIVGGIRDIPSASSIPTSHGYAGKGYEWIFGKGSTAPAGKVYETAAGEIITSSGAGYSVSGIIQGAMHAIAIYYGVKMVAGLFGMDDATSNAAATAMSMGYFAGSSAYSLFGTGGIFGTVGLSPLAATGIGLVVAVIVFIATYKKVSTKTIEFKCEPWDARTGGDDCEKCNNQGILPCSEYQCRSLGQSCQLLNPGTEDVKCAWINKNDVDPPVIKPWNEILLDDYKYTPDNTISPPDKGVIIEYSKSSDKCVPAFTRLAFGVVLDEPAKCKIDYVRKNTFDEMEFFFGESSLFKYNHSQVMSLPGAENLELENLTMQNDGEYELYTRCQDANGNYNTANFVFKYCVDKGPDTTPPLIVTTSLLNNMPVAYNTTEVNLEVYVNEPAECKWSHLDQDYDNMEETMSCSSSVFEMNAQMLYTCETTLTGLKNNQENKFYFRCKDKPLATEDRNVNTESYEFIIIGTRPLVIDSVEPNGTIKDSTEVIKVTLKAKTSAGYKEGESICYYSDTENEDDYIMFYETLSYEHAQELWLPQGDYEYFIKCIDLGGNSDTEKVNFKVESDTSSPIVVRAYHEANNLILMTNEEAECVYDTRDCSYLFEDGTSITSTDDLEHRADWNTKTDFYIKCQDNYGNRPAPNECSIIVRAFEV